MRHSAFAVLLIAASPSAVGAQEASFGCKVLMCAASQNPSWDGVPYCVPVMHMLFAQMKFWRFSWPICHEAGTGEPGYEPYEPCPKGAWPVTAAEDLAQSETASLSSGELAFCARERPAPLPGTPDWFRASAALQVVPDIEVFPRQRRNKPYFFDVPDSAGGHQRVYFDVR
jgi:hypothetical protein